MSYYMRMMSAADVSQVSEIDREAFPTMLPSPNYRREMENPLAHYIVACDEGRTVPEERRTPNQLARLFGKMAGLIRQVLGNGSSPGQAAPVLEKEYVVGFAGFWMMVDEAHVTSIAIRPSYRGRGIGALLLLALTEMAVELKARAITLEVRASNRVAINLYKKYGFVEVGRRKGYYADNQEDAILMTLDNIGSDSSRAHLEEMKRGYDASYGRICRSGRLDFVK